MPLQLSYQGETGVPVEVEGINPETVRDLPLADIEQLPVFHGNRKSRLADFFEVSGDPSDERIVWSGELSGVHWIGTKMSSGTVLIEGNAGRHLGSEMRGGSIEVRGDAGDWVGGEMQGGQIRVRGSAGHLVGSAYRGSARGMSGGVILIDGNVGNEIGHSMRRGLLVVGGNARDLIGFNMLAGTILVLGETGIRHGASMRRGTIGFLGGSPDLLPSFRHACRYEPEFMHLLFQSLTRHEFSFDPELPRKSVDLYNGDLIEGGRGEILIPAGD